MLKDNEIRRLLSYLRAQIEDDNLLAAIEDEMRGEDGEEIAVWIGCGSLAAGLFGR